MNIIKKSELLWALSPNWLKRRKIRPLIAEFNRRIELRNRAYPGVTPMVTLLDELDTQNSDSLDQIYLKLNDDTFMPCDQTHHWEQQIVSNLERDERLRQFEQAQNLMRNVLTTASITDNSQLKNENEKEKEMN